MGREMYVQKGEEKYIRNKKAVVEENMNKGE